MLRYLGRLPAEKLRHILSGPHTSERSGGQQIEPELPLDEIGNLPLEAAAQIINDTNTKRRTLEQIAVNRFGMPSGSLPSLSSKAQLLDKLNQLIESERAHATIQRLASSKSHSG
ncbi:MAG TPA: hypothetical protein VGB82_01880 [Alphaproteobacteria bacterium]